MENQVLDDVFESESSFHLVEASRGKRFANVLIDYVGMLFFLIVLMIIAVVAGVMDESALDNDALLNLIAYGGMFSYYVGFEYFFKGKTLGKLVTRTRVVTINGEQPTLSNLLGRTLCRFIPLEPFSYLGSRDSGWHDRFSKTMVINERQSELPLQKIDFV